MSNFPKELGQLRKDIDKLDAELLKILKQRFALVKKIALIKHKHGLPLHQKGRWESLLSDRLKLSGKMQFDPTFILKLFKLIHTESKRIQKIKIQEVQK